MDTTVTRKVAITGKAAVTRKPGMARKAAATARKAGAALLGLCLAHAAGAQDGSGNVCEDQIRKVLADRFGQSVGRIEFRYRSSAPADGGFFNFSQAIVYPNECPGYHFFELNADDYACERQTYLGEVPRFAMYRSSGDGC